MIKISDILWSLKHVPTKMSETFAPQIVTRNLRSMEDGVIPHIIFSGPVGCGKFTLAKLFAERRVPDPYESLRLVSESPITAEERKKLNRESYVSKRKVGSGAGKRFTWPSFLHARVIDFVSSAPLRFPFKIVVIREFQKIAEQASFRRIMEYYPYCRFLLTSSNPGSIIDPIKSRCITIALRKPRVTDFIKRMQNVEEEEHVSIPIAVIKYLYSFFHGNLGSAINVIQFLHIKKQEVTMDNAKSALETLKPVSVIPLLQSAFDGSLPMVKQRLDKLLELSDELDLYERINEEVSQQPLQNQEDKENVCDWLQFLAAEEPKLLRGYNKRIQLVNILMNL